MLIICERGGFRFNLPGGCAMGGHQRHAKGKGYSSLLPGELTVTSAMFFVLTDSSLTRAQVQQLEAWSVLDVVAVSRAVLNS